MAKAYAEAGVNVEAGYDVVRQIKNMAAQTFDSNVLNGLGSFGGFYSIENARTMRKPVLVSGTDGVGTKLRLAMLLNKHDTIGIDCVAMCVNDIACHAAKPLFFLDYLAVGKLEPDKAAKIVSGVAEGCRQAGCALIGGETAEMPGFYAKDEYDLAGFAVGLVDQADVIDGSRIQTGDTLIGLASSGAHSNGYSLIRKIFSMTEDSLSQWIESMHCTLGEALLRPTRIYVNAVQAITKAADVKGIAHITGGGFIENVPRIMPDGLCARIDLTAWPMPPLFTLMQQTGGLDWMEMYNIFNMGIGMVMAVNPNMADKALEAARQAGETAYIIGDVVQGEEKVQLLK